MKSVLVFTTRHKCKINDNSSLFPLPTDAGPEAESDTAPGPMRQARSAVAGDTPAAMRW